MRLAAARHLRAPGAHPRVHHTHKRATTDDTKAGREKDKEVQQEEDNRRANARALVCYSPHPSVFTWAAEENRSDSRKKRVSYYVSYASVN